MNRLLVVFAATAAIALPSAAQTFQRKAIFVGDRGDHGKCTIEVVVDGAADVTIRGDQGTIRNLSGAPASWRRFQCNSLMPVNPAGFRFEGIDGRGTQQLIRDPRNSGGTAVVRIEDRNGGSEGYTFDLIWGGDDGRRPETVLGGGQGRGPEVGPGRGPDNGFGRGPERGPDSRFPATNRWTTEQAVNGCQDAIRVEARNRFRGRRVEFLDTRIDNNPGRNDWVTGAVEIYRGRNIENHYRFTCQVNFDNGRVRAAEIEPRPLGRNWRSDNYGRDNNGAARALELSQVAVQNRLRRDGFTRTDFQSIRMDDAPGRNDWVVGNVRATGPRGSSNFTFSCSVDLRTGEVRSVNVNRR